MYVKQKDKNKFIKNRLSPSIFMSVSLVIRGTFKN